jgi:DNA repair protein RecO (recombination protein O)
MPLRRVSAIVLRTYRVGEADKVVVFFSRELGKLRGIAKGARRARSRFGGSLEIGNEVELTFFEKEGRDLPSVDRCDIVRSRFSRLGDPILATTLGYITDLSDAFLPEREANQRVYRLLRAAIGSLSSAEVAETRARYFEAWLLRLSGLYPLRHTCPSCGKPLHAEGAWFSFDERRLTCRNCRAKSERGFPLSPNALRFLDDVWRLPPDELEPPEANVLPELRELHYRLMQEHLEKDLKSLHVLEEMLRETAGTKPKP